MIVKRIFFIQSNSTKSHTMIVTQYRYQDMAEMLISVLCLFFLLQLHKLRSLAETFAKVPMKCTAYTMDLDSMLVIQLSFLDRHLIEAGLSTNEVQLRSTVQGWLTQIPSTGSLIEFVPYVINPGVF